MTNTNTNTDRLNACIRDMLSNYYLDDIATLDPYYDYSCGGDWLDIMDDAIAAFVAFRNANPDADVYQAFGVDNPNW